MFPLYHSPLSFMSSTPLPSSDHSEGQAKAAAGWEHQDATVRQLKDLGAEKHEAGQIEEAVTLYQAAVDKAVKEGQGPDELASLRTSLAVLLDSSGRDEDAAPVYEQANKDLAAQQPQDLVTIGQLRNNLAMIYKRLGKFALSEQHYLASIEALESVMGKGSEDVASLYNNLGGLYYAAGFPDQAKDVFMEALDMRLNILGADHPDVAQTHCNLGSVYYELEQNEAAQDSFEKALRILEAHIQDEAASYQAVGADYIAMLGAIEEDAKAATFQKRMENVLNRLHGV